MRIKKDKTSWHASGVITRDARNTKEPNEETKHSSKKNTKKWCLGKIGRKHTPEWKPARHGWTNAYAFACTKCRKELDYCHPSFITDKCERKDHTHEWLKGKK